jgi:hypothetical protein
MSWDLSSEEVICEKLENQQRTIFAFSKKIKELEAENKKLREALLAIRNTDWGTDHCDSKNMIADEALSAMEEK